MKKDIPTDTELLHAFAASGAPDAFRQLVERYAGMVYGVALRQTRDRHLADDVSQAVFLILADRAARLRPGTVLPAWLHTTARYAAANALRTARRRLKHEERAAAMTQPFRTDNIDPPVVPPLLDDALGALRPGERDAVVLRFMEGLSNDEVGRRLGITALAAAKRVSRAVDRMREFFRRRGVAVDGPYLGAAISAAGAHPASLTLALSAHASATGGTASPSVQAIAKGTQAMWKVQTVKLVCACGAAAAITLAAVAAVAQLAPAGAPVAAAGPTTAATASGPSTAPAFSTTLPDGRTVALLGVSRYPSPGEAWWAADGSPAAPPYEDAGIRHSDAADAHIELAVRLSNGDGTPANARELHWELDPNRNFSTGGTPSDGDGIRLPAVTTAVVETPPDGGPITFRLGVLAEKWEPFATLNAQAQQTGGTAGRIVGGRLGVSDGKLALTFRVDRAVTAVNRIRCIAVLKDGRRVEPWNERYNVEGRVDMRGSL